MEKDGRSAADVIRQNRDFWDGVERAVVTGTQVLKVEVHAQLSVVDVVNGVKSLVVYENTDEWSEPELAEEEA